MRALLRRAGAKGEKEAPGEAAATRFALGDAEVDLEAFTLKRGGATHSLARREVALLALLWERRGRAVSREQILRHAWSDGGDSVGARTIDTHVLNLRQKLEADPAQPKWLLTVHGVGYRLQAEA